MLTSSETNSSLIEDLNANIATLNANITDLRQAIINLSDEPAPQPESDDSKPLVTIGIVGTRGHGQKHINAFSKLKNCRIAYVCDVDSKVGKASALKIEEAVGYRPKFVQDFRTMLQDKDLDAVSIATPHHWHALAAIECLRAGKHVYIEKPLTHSVAEGPSLMAAAEKYGKIVQAGTQLRSNSSLQAAGEYMRSGKLGKVELVHCITHKDRPPTPIAKESKIPLTVDYDLWCGPAPMDEVTRSKFHYHWHWLWRFGNGALGNNGVHRIDAARIALHLKGYGEKVLTVGGRYGPPDSGETPNNSLTVHKFGQTWILQDVLGLNPKPFHGIANAVIFYGSEGTIVYKSGYASLVDEEFKPTKRFKGKQLNHHYNFLLAIRENDQSVARGELQEGILSSDLCHIANISYRVGTKGTMSAARTALLDLDVPAMVMERFDALEENLTENKLDKEIIIGETLDLQNNQEKPFVNNPAATALLATDYREGFELPAPHEV